MHYHLEIIMPPSTDIQKVVDSIMEPFNENNQDDEYASGHAFWDFFVIGGRWAGTKQTCRYDANKIEQFYKQINDAKITVAGLQCGKQQISLDSQIPMVDKMWNDLFPTEAGEVTPCPLFAHSNNQYDSNDLLACDICRVDEIPDSLSCSRVIIAGPDYDNTAIDGKFMLCDSQWNGINHMPIEWDGKVKSVIYQFRKSLRNYKAEYVRRVTPQPDWICVTVDYHS